MVVEDIEDVGVTAEEGSGASVEVELLGESVEKIDGDRRVFGVCEDEVFNGNYFEEVFVIVHEFLECGVSNS